MNYPGGEALRDTCAMKGYGSFCPVAKTAEIFAERWTPLLLRELCMGVHRFGELQAALPRMSRALLVARLRELELAGVIVRVRKARGTGSEYHLTEAGVAFRPLIEAMSHWGQRWGTARVQPKDVDPGQLLWGMRRHADIKQLPARRSLPKPTILRRLSRIAVGTDSGRARRYTRCDRRRT